MPTHPRAVIMASSFVGDVWVGTSLGVLKGQGAAMKHIIFVELYFRSFCVQKRDFQFPTRRFSS